MVYIRKFSFFLNKKILIDWTDLVAEFTGSKTEFIDPMSEVQSDQNVEGAIMEHIEDCKTTPIRNKSSQILTREETPFTR